MEMQGTEDLQQKVSGASPVELVIILYDGALRFLENCRHAWQDGDDAVASENLLKAKNIVLELQKSLKPEDDGTANNLFSVYEKVQTYLKQAQETKETVYLDFVKKILLELKETWIEVNKK